MCKKNIPLYMLTSANLIYALSYGFNWLTWFALGLSLVVFSWDLWEVIHYHKK